VAYFLDYHNRKYNCRARALCRRADGRLRKYHWPGNIRELENLIKRYVILGNEEVISADLTPRPPIFQHGDSVDGQISLKKLTRQAVRELERKVILKVLQNCHWNRKQAARYRVEHQLPGGKSAVQDSRRSGLPDICTRKSTVGSVGRQGAKPRVAVVIKDPGEVTPRRTYNEENPLACCFGTGPANGDVRWQQR
jgi:hypothetical protein